MSYAPLSGGDFLVSYLLRDSRFSGESFSPVPMWQVNYLHVNLRKNNGSNIMPDPGGHRPRRYRPYAQAQTCPKQEQAQGVAQGRKQKRTAGGAATSGRRTKQEGARSPTVTWTEAGECTAQIDTAQIDTVPNIATSCVKGDDGPGQRQGRGETGKDKPVAATMGP